MAKKQIQSFSADSVKAISDVVKRVRGMGMSEGGGGHRKPLFNGDEDITVPIRNTTNNNALAGYTYQLDDLTVDIDTLKASFPVYNISRVGDGKHPISPLVVCTQDIPKNMIGRGSLYGISKVVVEGTPVSGGRGWITNGGLCAIVEKGYLDILYISEDSSWAIVILPYNPVKKFFAKITGEPSTGLYDWVEQDPIVTSNGWQDLANGRSSADTNTNKKATEFNNRAGLYYATLTINGSPHTVGAEKTFVVEMLECVSAAGDVFYRFYSPFGPYSRNTYQLPTYNQIVDSTKGGSVEENVRFQ